MNFHLNILPKQAKLDLRSSKLRWRLEAPPQTPLGSLRRSPYPLIVREPPSRIPGYATACMNAFVYAFMHTYLKFSCL